MESDRRMQIQRSLRTLAESYKATIELMEQTVAMICDEGIGESIANANVEPLLQNTITLRNLVIDPALFSVTFRGKVCFLGNSYPFKFLCRLALRPNAYVAYEILLAEVWRGMRSDAAFVPVVSSEDFFIARGIFQERARRLSNEEMLARLRSLAHQHATLSSQIIDAADDAPASSAYRSRFGSLLQAYRLAGFEPDRDYRYIEVNRELRTLYPQLVADVTSRLDAVGATVTRDAITDLLLINGEFSASMVLSRCRQTPAGSLRWLIQIDQQLAPDITILVRMDPSNTKPADYYLLPIMDIESPRLLLCETNGAHLDTYQFDNLDYLAKIAMRRKIEVAA